MTKSITVLGSTGVMGRLTLDVAAHLGGEIAVTALAAGQNARRLAEQVVQFRPQYVSVANPETRDELCRLLDGSGCVPEIGVGPEGLARAADVPTDVVVTAVVGAVGLIPTWRAISRGATIALANKETLVAAGDLVMPYAAARGAAILPLDSEHSAIFQCLQGATGSTVSRYLLTASGGPFRQTPASELAQVTAADALRHPTWSMGRKITVDSATLMNKGLEVIEAHHLFAASYDTIEVVVHPQSVIHSMVEFADGAVLAQLGVPDMRVPIQFAFTYPKHLPRPDQRLNFAQLQQLTFEAPDVERFPCLRLARAAGEVGGYAPCVMNAANEVAVEAFLQGRLSFTGISAVVEETLGRIPSGHPNTVEDVVQMDEEARSVAVQIVRESR
ncbi:MAG: 1-deoxy-D-xylulose-5-phosphate reductoisomerase [Alicyclobacillus sp.]|nr:1-deoxy-D-xylulose-5-phosphate reductoisomerase [Alicyclobacillus sp.]